jgi:hypothetical protein
VQWWDSAGDLILSGAFTGIGTCAHLKGTVTGFTATGFTLETSDKTVTVVVTEETAREEFGDHELALGDKVKVEGCWDDDDFVAEEIELLNRDDHEYGCAKLVGIIGNVSGENFVLDTDDGSLPVVTTGETEWLNFGDHELAIGDKVKVEGCWDGDVFVAEVVELKGGNDSGEKCGNLMGVVTEVSLPSFTMKKGNKTIQVLTTDDTEWEEFGDQGITVADKVKVAGCWSDEVFVAEEVELKKRD